MFSNRTLTDTPSSPNRRVFVKSSLLLAAGLSFPTSALARLSEMTKAEKSLSFYNTHTGESIKKAVFWADGQYNPDVLQELNYILRDHRNGQVARIDPSLFELLFQVSLKMDPRTPIHIISGYRSPETNARLARQSGGVAKRSLHMSGKAIDIRLPGKNLHTLRKAAMSLKVGGVGYYPASDFVHIDTGRVRYW